MKPQHRLDDEAIDRWVQLSLRERYAATLTEPPPDMLIKLLRPDPSGN